MEIRSWTVKGGRRFRLVGEGWGLGREVGEGSGGEVVEDSFLAFGPGVVQGAGAALAAGALLHDAVRDLERALHGLHGIAQGDPFGRSSQAGASPPSLVALHQTGASELRHHAGEQPPRHRRLCRDPVSRHQLAPVRITRQIHQRPQRVATLARQLELHRPALLLPITGKIHPHACTYPRESIRHPDHHTHTYYVIVTWSAIGPALSTERR